MPEDFIKIRGARVHNLKNVSLDIPKNKLVVITGISGSGKSSLAFDTLYAEGQRRYIESLSSYARQFLGIMDKPDVDKIEGVSPAISIDQRKAGHNPRSTVGTITEIYDYLRLLFARVGVPHCPKCGKQVAKQNIGEIVKQILKLPKSSEIIILGPVIRGEKGEHYNALEKIQRAGFVSIRINGIIYKTAEAFGKTLDAKKKHNIEAVVDRLILDKDLDSVRDPKGKKKTQRDQISNGVDKSRLMDSLETALNLGKGIVIVSCKPGTKLKLGAGSVPYRNEVSGAGLKIENLKNKSEDLIFSENFACERCKVFLPELEPRAFSFNSPYGACPACQGLGEKLEVDPELVIPNLNLTLAEGAIFPWAHASRKIGRQDYFWRQLEILAEKHEFSLDEPVKNLLPKIVNLILYGSDDFIGVIPNLEKRYRETDSDYTRKEIEQYMVEKECEACKGKRLRPEVLAVTVAGETISQITEMPVVEILNFFQNKNVRHSMSSMNKVSQPIIKEIVNRLQFLIDVGLDYLTLSRKADSISGGEEGRIKLATQIGSKLSGVLYILDEPSIGLHARDQQKLINTLKQLRDLGNTVIVVEHDPQTIKAADWIIDVGPGAGKHGGRITFEGTFKSLLKSRTLTGDYLSGRKKVEVVQKPRPISPERSDLSRAIIIKGAKEHNLKNIDVKIPLGKFVCITGVSGSGKSSLMNDILAKALLKKFYNAKEEPGEHKEILGIENLNKVVLVDQSPIGRTPRSNPATYTSAFSYIRDLFAQTKEAKTRGYRPGRFSFNLEGGRCETCEGQGVKKIEMYFLSDVYTQCPECKGKRFNRETLSVEYKGKNISQVLEMTVEEALEFFKNIPGLYEKLKTLHRVGLSYVQIGQPAPSLSGGEAQRVKLASELSKKATGRTLYILDEPTTGLHFDDIKKLIQVLKGLVEKGNTVLVIEHNLDVMKNADYILDLGPESGEKGGYLVAEGLPRQIARVKKSHTGRYLTKVLG